MKRTYVSLWLALLVALALVAAQCPAAPEAPPEEPPAPEEPMPPAEEEVVEEPAPPEPEEEEAPPPEAVEVIKVGALLPLTGTDAINGQNQQLAHDLAVEEINAAGGIKCLGGAQLQMVYGDSQGRPEAGNAETERLITREGVITVMGAFHSGVTLTATEIAERYEVPFIVPNALAGEITARGLKYTFKTAVSIEQMAEDSANFAADMGGASTAAILVPNITFGEEFAKAWRQTLPAAGLEIVADLAYPSGASDLQDSILSLRSANPDVIFTIGNTADATLFVRQMRELDYWPNVALVSAAGGFADPTLVLNLGESAEYLFLTNDWFPNINLPGAKEINDHFRERFGIDMTGNINTTYAATWLLADALEVACSTDPNVLADTLRNTVFEEGEWRFMYPMIDFDDETGFNMYTSNVIAQIIDGKPVVVWPEEMAVTDAVWPVPAWGDR